MRESNFRYHKLLILSGLLLLDSARAESDYSKYISTSLGMVNVSFAESDTVLSSSEDDDGAATKPGSGSASIMSFDMSYHVPTSAKREWFARMIIPFQPSSGNALVYGGFGMNHFFNGQSSDVMSNDSEVDVRITPKFRYYAGGQVGFGYLIYVTESAKKTDILMELGAQAGTIYAWKERWGIKGELSIGRGVGTKVSTTSMRMIVGTTYTF